MWLFMWLCFSDYCQFSITFLRFKVKHFMPLSSLNELSNITHFSYNWQKYFFKVFYFKTESLKTQIQTRPLVSTKCTVEDISQCLSNFLRFPQLWIYLHKPQQHSFLPLTSMSLYLTVLLPSPQTFDCTAHNCCVPVIIPLLWWISKPQVSMSWLLSSLTSISTQEAQ